MARFLRSPEIDPWASALSEARTRMRPLFTQARVAESAATFIEMALVGRGRRNGWMRATLAGDAGPWRQQALVGRALWCADALRDIVRDYVVDHIGATDAVLAVSEVAFLKQGDESCGVARQPISPRKRIANSQIGIVLAYASDAGIALVDRGLHIPPAWIVNPGRMTKAGVPDSEHGGLSRAQLAERILARTLASGIPSGFITAPVEFLSELAPLARRTGHGLMASIDGSVLVGSPLGRPHVRGSASDIARRLPFSAWHRARPDTRLDNDDWAACELSAADNETIQPHRRRGLLVRRINPGGNLLFYQSEHPIGTPRNTLVAAAQRSQSINAVLRLACGEHGLDHNETRSWHGWHRHVTLVMMALAVRAAASRTGLLASGRRVEPHAISTMVRT